MVCERTVAVFVHTLPACALESINGRLTAMLKITVSPGAIVPPVWLHTTVAALLQVKVAALVPPILDALTTVLPLI